MKPDPFDLAISRLDQDELDALPVVVGARLNSLRALLIEDEAHTLSIAQYLSHVEVLVMKHRADRLRAEIVWHEELLNQLPAIVIDERSRSTKGHES